MKPEDDTSGYVYTHIQWRYSGLATKFFGVDPSILLLIPVGIIGLRQGYGWGLIIFMSLIAALYVYVSAKGYPSMRSYLQSRAVRYLGRARWKTR